MSHSKTHLEHVMKVLIEEAGRWDLEPKLASLWWTGTYASEEMEDITICTRTRRGKIPFEKSFRILGYSFNQAWKTQDCLEERMQSANKVWRRDAKIDRSRDVPWRVKCRRMMDHVCCVVCFGSKFWSWSQATLDRIKGWETHPVRRLLRFSKNDVDKDEAANST